MREIKFRAWDKDNKEFVLDFSYVLGFNGDIYGRLPITNKLELRGGVRHYEQWFGSKTIPNSVGAFTSANYQFTDRLSGYIEYQVGDVDLDDHYIEDESNLNGLIVGVSYRW